MSFFRIYLDDDLYGECETDFDLSNLDDIPKGAYVWLSGIAIDNCHWLDEDYRPLSEDEVPKIYLAINTILGTTQ